MSLSGGIVLHTRSHKGPQVTLKGGIAPVDLIPTPPPSGYVSIAEAAEIIGSKPWDVVRLIEAEKVSSIQLVSVESLHAFREAS